MTKKTSQKIKKFHWKPSYTFYLGFFGLYFFATYFLLYHSNGLQPFQINIHFFSNVVASLCKRFLSEAVPYALLFALIAITQTRWKRLLPILAFSCLFLINTLSIGFYYYAKTNYPLYFLEGFQWKLLFSMAPAPYLLALGLLLLTLLLIDFTLYRTPVLRIKAIPVFKKRFWVSSLALLSFVGLCLPVQYSWSTTLFSLDPIKKKFSRTMELEQAGYLYLAQEIQSNYFPTPSKNYTLSADEQKQVDDAHLDTQIATFSGHHPHKIILIAVESLDQKFLSHYNPELPQPTPNLDRALDEYPHLDEFYPSGTYTVFGLSSLLCGHTNQQQMNQNPRHECMPQLLKNAGYKTEYINGFSKFYVSENIHFGKYGFDSLFAQEDLDQKYPSFKKERPDLYNSWGFSDNIVFDEAIGRLKTAKPEDKLFLTLSTVDTHMGTGRCFDQLTPEKLDYPILFSVGCFDRAFGQFMDKLKNENLLNEDLAVIVTADHLYPFYHKTPGYTPQNNFLSEPARIPLAFITPQPLTLVAQQGSQIDVAATVLDLAGLPIPTYYMGKSLLSNPYTTPIGQDGMLGYMIEGGYMIKDGVFIPLSVNLNEHILSQDKTAHQKGFLMDRGLGDLKSNDELQNFFDEKVQEREQNIFKETAFSKWYYNKYFDLE